MTKTAESYLKPSVIQTVSRLDLRAKFIVEGFLQGLHASPFHGFSVEFSEHRRYTQGDDPKDIDWLVYAKTDRYYIKKYQAETNIQGYLLMDLSESMGYTYRQDLTKFDYAICLAAALGYMMIHQQDPVGLITFDEKLRNSLPPKSKRSQLGNLLGMLAKAKPAGQTELAANLKQIGAMIRTRSLLMIFTDLLADPDEVIASLRQLRFAGHDIILFHVLDEAEVYFPFEGMVDLKDPESNENLVLDADGMRSDYLDAVAELRGRYKKECLSIGADYVALDTSMPFDKALLEYLSQRQARF
ncbi:MAG: DUF58 domain-containing protein [Planctomycetaceae bacterium]|jgi:uncharacterized protein (DUF58 family)|nr:DUF58 domain-containing protein [bacterium]MDC0274424.1 DUF58 domain-containing protein [Planctomycetaceae bacterium]MDG2390560.1 DUF58 domain-containing protein [Planctomycetaceae bacterium]